MQRDGQGLVVGGADAAICAALDRFTDEVRSHGREAGSILAVAEAAPDCCLAQADAAAIHLFLQTAEGRRRAAAWLDRARAALPQAGERERLFVAALEAWAAGDGERALDLHVAIARDWPRDLVNLKIAQVHQLNRGDRQGMRELAAFALPHNPDTSYVRGLLAFALEQTGELEAAERHGLAAVAMNPDDPWAQHAVAHVLEARGVLEQGAAFLETHSRHWDRCSSFMYTHNWWHLALFRLDMDDEAGALAIHDGRVWGVRKTYVQDQVNAVALLSRLELHGVDVGDRWQDVADHVLPRIHDRENAFLDLHFLYALARAGRVDAVAEMLEGLALRASTAPDWCRVVWRDIALPAAHGMAAHAAGRWRDAADFLGPLLPLLSLVGGSTAQQDWFERIHLDSLLRAGARDAAHAVCRRRVAQRAAVPWQLRTLAGTAAGTGPMTGAVAA